MSTGQFLVLATTVMAVLFAALAIERYRICQEKKDWHCRPGPNLGNFGR